MLNKVTEIRLFCLVELDVERLFGDNLLSTFPKQKLKLSNKITKNC